MDAFYDEKEIKDIIVQLKIVKELNWGGWLSDRKTQEIIDAVILKLQKK